MVSKKYALILPGGSARACFTLGVLKYLYQDMPRKYGFKPDFKIICGTSAGAIHAAYLASHIQNIDTKLPHLISILENLKPSDVLSFDPLQILRWKDIIYGGDRSSGIFDTTPLRLLVQREADWRSIDRNIQSGTIETVCISATSTDDGSTRVFTQTNQPLPGPGFRSHFKPVQLGAEHIMASASLPILFPPEQISGEYFTDGGTASNTPIAPAVAFGATHVFSIGLWRDPKILQSYKSQAPSASSILGKIFNSFFIGAAEVDFYNLNFINNIIEEGVKFAGKGFLKHLQSLPRPFRFVQSCSVGPSQDIGKIAAQYISDWSFKKNWYWKLLLKIIDIHTTEADFTSYLLFDGEFSKLLIDLGYKDALAHEKEILEFFDIKLPASEKGEQ